MKYSLIKSILITVLMGLSISNASAGLLGIYAGASVGTSELENGADDTGTKLYAGYRFLGPLAVEVANVDLGQYGATSVDGLSVDAVAFLPLGVATLFAKVGLFNWNADYSGVFPAESGTDSKVGFGLEYDLFANLDLRVEWEKYSNITDLLPQEVTYLSVGVNISF